MGVLGRVVRQQYIGVVALVLSLGGIGYAATGGTVLLGRGNTADKPTAIKNSGLGAALNLAVREGQPPLATNSDERVKGLNADLLDGRHAAAFRTVGTSYSKSQSDRRYPRVIASNIAFSGAVKKGDPPLTLLETAINIPSAGNAILFVGTTQTGFGFMQCFVGGVDRGCLAGAVHFAAAEAVPLRLVLSHGGLSDDPASATGSVMMLFLPD